MSNAEKCVKKRETRIKQRCKEREELFISDYIKHKYPDVYGEAVRIYELLTNHYPNKIDVRKTAEHKAWKINGTASLHPAFNIRQTVIIPPNAQVRIFFPEQNPEPSATPEHPPNPEPSATTEQPPNPEPSTTPEHPPNPEPSTTTEQPPNPEPSATTEQPPNPEPSATPEHPPNPEPSASIEPPTPEPITPESQASPEPPTPPKPKGKATYADNMRLIIPLLKPPVKHPGLITETLEIVTEEILQGDQQQPTSMEQIDPQTLEQLISELRADPDLKDIFADIEQQFEQEQGMDIDIDMDTRLEDELENWEFW